MITLRCVYVIVNIGLECNVVQLQGIQVHTFNEILKCVYEAGVIHVDFYILLFKTVMIDNPNLHSSSYSLCPCGLCFRPASYKWLSGSL